MYPARSSFDDSSTYGVWWAVNRSSGQDICAINAAAWLLGVRSALGLSAQAVWDAALSQALVNAANVLNGQQPGQGFDALGQMLQTDANMRAVSNTGFQFATWFAFYRPNRLRYDVLAVPADIALPRFGQVYASPSGRRDGAEGDRLACYRPETEATPASLSASDRRALEQASSIGVRVRPGEPTDQGVSEIDTGPSAIPPWAIAAGGGLVLVAAILFVTSTRTKSSGRSRARSNPHAWMGPTS